MRIAVITYSFAQNWGAVLQAYALVEHLNDMGHDAKLIQYRNFDNTTFITIKSIADGIIDLIKWRENKERVKRFNEFRLNYFRLTKKCSNEEELRDLNRDFDCFITGSDQVWNVGRGVCKDYYLNFADENKRRISYAASFGVSYIPEQYHRDIQEGLFRIEYLSVREQSGAKIVKELSGKEAQVVLDPVFLRSREQWDALVGQERLENRPYIFVYPTQITKTLEETIKQFKKEYGCIAVSPFAIKGCKTIKNIGPKQFVSYIRDAEAVIASSFHATAFSIIYQKELLVVTHSITGSRTTDLLESLKMHDSIVTDVSDISKSKCCSLRDINLLRDRIAESKEFLLKATNA